MSKTDAPKLILRSLLSPRTPRGGDLWAAVLAAAASAILILCLLLATRTASSSSATPRFGIVIDAGSTGTRIHVFGYAAAAAAVLDLGETAVMRASPGLSSYAGDPDRAGESLVELLEFGKGKVPRDQWGDTEVRLMATAGMRIVDAEARGRILESCRRVLKVSGFRFRDDWATVISGVDEGIYAWVAANYALGTLGGDPQKTTGIIELGGASAQVAFVSSEPMPPEFSHAIEFGGTTYNLYSNSFLHFGQNIAYESLHQLLRLGDQESVAESVQKGIFIDPCTPKGYSHSVKELSAGANRVKTEYQPVANSIGNFSECRSVALKLLNKGKDKCLYQQCRLGSTFIPKLEGRFVATENFFYTAKFFGLGPMPVLSDFILAGEQFCGEDWSKLKKKYHTLDEEILSHYCFSSAYIVSLLHDSLGIALDDKSRIGFAKQLGDIQLEWPLGAFIIQRSSASVFHVDSASPLALFAVSVLLVFSAWSVWRWRWRKPQLKTVYDLEKGRYIVTRINL